MFNWLKKHLSSSASQLESGESSDDCASLIASAGKAMAVGDAVEAAQCYRRALVGRPHDAQLHVALSFALKKLMLYAEARLNLNRAILLDPCNANAFYLLGKVAQEQGDLFGAIDNFNEALDIQPDLEVVFNDLAAALWACGRKNSAEQILIKGIYLYPQSARLHFELGSLYARANEWENASASYRKALSINPNFHEA